MAYSYTSEAQIERFLIGDVAIDEDSFSLTAAQWTTWLEELEDAAINMVDSYCRRDFLQHTSQTEYHDGDGGTILFFDHSPVISLTSITVEGSLVATSDYYLYANEGYVKLWSNSFAKNRPRNVVVVYTYGYASVPAMIAHVTAEIIANMIKKVYRETESSGVNRKQIGDYEAWYGDKAVFTAEMKEKLNYYRRDLVGAA